MAKYQYVILNQNKDLTHDNIVVIHNVDLPDDDSALGYLNEYEQEHSLQTVIAIYKAVCDDAANGYHIFWRRHFPVKVLTNERQR